MQKPDAIIFDMDGTLWDAVDSYVWIWNEGFRQLNIPKTFTREDLLGQMGKQPDVLIAESIADCPGLDHAVIYKTVFELQEKTMPLLGGKLYEGVLEGIKALSEKYTLLLLSNCEHYATGQFLEYTQLKPYFTDAICFGDTRLPKAMNLQLLKARHQLQNPIYVGDTEGDAEQTRQSGMPFVFASYGFGNTNDYDLCFDSFKSLSKHFLNL